MYKCEKDMVEKLPTLQQLIRLLQTVPYLASKNVYRVASHFLEMNDEQVAQFCAMLMSAKKNLIQCKICFCLREASQECAFCTSPKRDHRSICVVETWQELFAIEKTQGYSGVYHVLGGAICPLEGIGPEELSIEQLIERVNHETQEIILATNQTPEGEATATYIAHKLRGKNIKISCLARGLQVGSSLETTDRVTIYKALLERRLF